MRAVAEAERRLLGERTTKAYVGARGDTVFADRITEIVLGEPKSQRVAAVQATGGTGALRILAGLIARSRRAATVWLPDPTWLNHHTIFSDAGLRTATYPYYDRQFSRLRIAAMFDAMKAIPSGDIVLFHGCCHNPCGADLSHTDWEAVAELIVRRGIVPFVDLAYQGFGAGLDEDAFGVRLLASRAPELLVASSCSKNFGIYSERRLRARVERDGVHCPFGGSSYDARRSAALSIPGSRQCNRSSRFNERWVRSGHGERWMV